MLAKTLTRTQKIAEAIPGAWCPQWIRPEPIAGPTTAPRLVAAESQPRLFARSFGSLASATYA